MVRSKEVARQPLGGWGSVEKLHTPDHPKITSLACGCPRTQRTLANEIVISGRGALIHCLGHHWKGHSRFLHLQDDAWRLGKDARLIAIRGIDKSVSGGIYMPE